MKIRLPLLVLFGFFPLTLAFAGVFNSREVDTLAKDRRWQIKGYMLKNISVLDYMRLDGGRSVYLLDTRPREAFALSHALNAHNIPIDELEMRMEIEIPKGSTVVIYCGSTKDCEQGSLSGGLKTYCSVAYGIMEKSGIASNILVLNGLLTDLEHGGILMQAYDFKLRKRFLNRDR